METPLETMLVQPGGVAPPTLPPLRPMNLGEVLDRALQLYRSNFWRLFTVMLVFQTPIFALNKAFQSVIQSKAPVISRPGAFQGVLPTAEQFAWVFGAMTITLIAWIILYQLAVGCLTSAAARAFLGEPIEPAVALKEGLRRAPQLLGTVLIVLVWTTFLIGLSTVPGALLAGLSELAPRGAIRLVMILVGVVGILAAQVVVGLYLFLRYALVSEVVVVERISFLKAMGRSASLMSGRVGPTFWDNCKVRASIVYAVTFCVSLVVAVVTAIPTQVVYGAFGVSPFRPDSFDPAKVPLWALLPVEVFQFATQAAVVPFGLLAIIVFYFDIRIKREGFDLEFLATRVLGGAK